MKLDVVVLGNRLVHIREGKGESLSAIAEAAGIAKSYLAKLERGEVENPGLRTLDAVAKALDVTLADLLARTSRNPDNSNTSTAEEREALFNSMPRSLREFVDLVETRDAEELPVDVIRSLATLRFRGKRPETVDDWRWVYGTLERGLR
jgi:XRE family transcriptional regulator of biofilm formation